MRPSDVTGWSAEYWPDNIESNVTSVAQNTSSAADELTTAHEYQRKAGRRMACLLVILVIVMAVILLAVSTKFQSSLQE